MGACATKPNATEGGSAPVTREETMPEEKKDDVVKETGGGGDDGGETDRRSLGVLMSEVKRPLLSSSYFGSIVRPRHSVLLV